MSTDLFSAGPWPDPAMIDVDERPLAVVRRERVTLTDLREIFDSSYGPAAAAASTAGAEFVGPALAVYEGDPTGVFTIEVGFPLDRALAGPAEIGGITVGPSALAPGRLAVLTHVGSYESLAESWARLTAWVREQGLAPAARYGEIYVTEPTPDTDPATLRSDLFLPLG